MLPFNLSFDRNVLKKGWKVSLISWNSFLWIWGKLIQWISLNAAQKCSWFDLFLFFLLRLEKKRCFFKTHFPSLKYACIFLCTCVYTCYIFIFMLDLSSWDFKVIDEMDYLTPRDMNIKWITIWKWSLFSYRDEIFFYCVLTSKTESTYGSKTVITIVICFCK